MARSSTKGATARLGADDWLRAGLDLLAEEGINGIKIQRLCDRLGVTKGSFYWHFPSRDALLQAALERWENVEQEALFGALEKVTDPHERLRALIQMVAAEIPSHVIYSALLQALDHPIVQPVIGRMSERRLQYLTSAFRQVGFEPAKAKHRARLAYSAYVGFLQLSLQLPQSRLDLETYEQYIAHVMETLIPA